MDTVMVGLHRSLIGEILEKDVYNEEGTLVVSKGTYITEKTYLKMESYYINSIHIKKKKNSNNINKEFLTIKTSYLKNVNIMETLFKEIAINGKIDEEKVVFITNTITFQNQKVGYFIDCIHDLKSVDEYTYTHSINVAIYSMLIGTWLNFSEIDINYLVLSGILHDIGKSKVPNDILNKKGSLTLEEFDIMKKHSQLGYTLIKSLENIPEEVKIAVLMHHEKLDGSGYPLGIKQNQISKYAQILAVADVYDALTSKRIYKNKITPFETFREMIKMGYSHFSPDVLMTFLKNISYYYIGFKFKLNNGEIGEIVHISPYDDYNPIIRVGEKIINLAEDKSVYIVEFI